MCVWCLNASKVLRLGIVALAGILLVWPASMIGVPEFAQTSVSAGEMLPAVTDQMLLNAQSDAKDWLLNGHDYTNERYSALDQITPDNVGQLKPRWILHTGIQDPLESSPIVVDGTMFLTTSYDHVIALDAATGQIRWRYDPDLGPAVFCCGPVNRGAAVAYGKVFVARLDSKLAALDEQTGKEIWVKTVADWRQGYSLTLAPTVIGGAVLVGLSGAELNVRGFVAAYSQSDGHELWRWWAVPGPQWVGSWKTTTPEGDNLHRNIARERTLLATYPDAWKFGGVPIWSTPAVDPTLHLAIFGTGNPAPQLNGDMRPGDNLYSESIVALDYRTGKLVWYYQFLPHDVWDYDAASPVVLFDLQHNGQTIPAVAQAGKIGWVYILDRRTGQRIRRSEAFVPQQHILTPPTAKGVLVIPGSSGGSQWSPTAYSPQTGYFYVLGVYRPQMFQAHNGNRPELQVWRGSAHPDVPNGPTWGYFVAVDASSGKIAWQVKTSKPMVGGAVATATGLVFTGEGTGNVDAYDAKTGKVLWQFKTEAGANGPPVVFEANGEEFLTIGIGGNFVVPAPYGDAFYTFALPKPGQSGPAIIGQPPARAAIPPSSSFFTGGRLTAVAGQPGWVQADAGEKIVHFDVTVAQNSPNGQYDFNGAGKGALTVTVPQNWLVQIHFSNAADLPHSLVVQRTAAAIPVQAGAPAFVGAATPNAVSGLNTGQGADLQFRATSPGRFWMICGVPGHAISGMWDYFDVSPTSNAPSARMH
jgi:alcohol dehydrogenase (cytochrome c)